MNDTPEFKTYKNDGDLKPDAEATLTQPPSEKKAQYYKISKVKSNASQSNMSESSNAIILLKHIEITQKVAIQPEELKACKKTLNIL